MELESAQKVFGFDCGLDWRPTVFVNGIPSNRVCSACGLVPANIGLLPCRHVLCQPCYDRCVSNGSRCCLDGEGILPDDVLWSPISADSIVNRKIRCWNASWGCGVTGPASEVLQHFNNECQHHTVTCLRCQGSVAHKDIVNHLGLGVCSQTSRSERVTGENIDLGAGHIMSAVSNLDTKVSLLQRSFEDNLKCIFSGSMPMLAQKMTPESSIMESIQCLENTLTESAQLCRRAVDQMADAQASLQNNIGAVMSSLQGVKDEVGMLNASLSQTYEENSKTLAVCTKIKQSIDMLGAAGAEERKEMKEKLEAIENMMQDHLDSETASSECSEQCRGDVAGKMSFAESVSDLSLERRLNISEAVEWSMESWSQAREECNRRSSALIDFPDPGYFYGYHIRPSAMFRRNGKSQSLHVGFHVITGQCDRHLAWPMKKTLRLTLLHPTECGRVESIVACTACENFHSDTVIGLQTLPRWSTAGVDVKRLEEAGYVKDDKVLLRFEVLQCSTPNGHVRPQF